MRDRRVLLAERCKVWMQISFPHEELLFLVVNFLLEKFSAQILANSVLKGQEIKGKDEEKAHIPIVFIQFIISISFSVLFANKCSLRSHRSKLPNLLSIKDPFV